MLGRGTRKGDKYPDKSHFVVFDCFDGTLLEYFRNVTGMTAEPAEADGKTIAQIIGEIWNNQDRDYNTRRLVKRLRRIERQMSGEARESFARFIPDGDVGAFAEGLPEMLRSSFTETMKLLRDQEFQKLLVDYQRAPKTFLVAVETKDEVTSEWLIKGATGQEFKPVDYLKAFETFVHDNAEHVDALSILLSRPQGWGAKALKELRQTLVQAPERFTETNLQKAYAITHHKALVDIISMVKRAAIESSPLLTAEERVTQAVERVTRNRELTVDQVKWLEYIHQHLVANLSIEVDDFNDVPVLANRGGWGAANKVFDGELTQLLEELNEELVAA
jgi:type I restriction enzyme R subunit